MLPAVAFDVLIVLGCRVVAPTPSGVARPASAAQRRVERAVRAYHEQGAERVIVSGGKVWSGLQECEVLAEELIARGVPAEKVLKERESLTTRGNAHGVLKLLQGQPGLRLGLVTCDWHMQRALRTFRRLGLDPIAVPAAAPPSSLRVRAGRYLRERGSSALDVVLARWSFWP